MPTKKRRMMLSLPQELEHAFDDFREATGTAPASFVIQVLMEALPMIVAMTESSKAAKDDRLEAVEIMQRAMTSALHQGTAAQVEMDIATAPLRKARADHVRKSKP
jgi:hypothetical protein